MYRQGLGDCFLLTIPDGSAQAHVLIDCGVLKGTAEAEARMKKVAANIEEWAHEEYFVTEPGTPVVVVAPSGAGYSRADEILSEINFIGAKPIVISDRAPRHPAHLLPLAGELPEEFSPLLCALPLSLLGFYLAEALGKRSYNFSSEEIRVEHYDTIHRATIGEPA